MPGTLSCIMLLVPSVGGEWFSCVHIVVGIEGWSIRIQGDGLSACIMPGELYPRQLQSRQVVCTVVRR